MFRRATYRILIEGTVDSEWADRTWGMRGTVWKTPDGRTLTALDGELRDQAALSGLLNALYDLHLPVEAVKKLTEEEPHIEGE